MRIEELADGVFASEERIGPAHTVVLNQWHGDQLPWPEMWERNLATIADRAA